MEYIKTHRKEFEAEYDRVVKDAEEDRKYWEKRNQERIEKNRKMGPPPGKEEFWSFVQKGMTNGMGLCNLWELNIIYKRELLAGASAA